jgi:hypothetical protein
VTPIFDGIMLDKFQMTIHLRVEVKKNNESIMAKYNNFKKSKCYSAWIALHIDIPKFDPVPILIKPIIYECVM